MGHMDMNSVRDVLASGSRLLERMASISVGVFTIQRRGMASLNGHYGCIGREFMDVKKIPMRCYHTIGIEPGVTYNNLPFRM